LAARGNDDRDSAGRFKLNGQATGMPNCTNREAILGIDAAWTNAKPSGVALLKFCCGQWCCAGLAPSYNAFLALAQGQNVNWNQRPVAGAPNPAALLQAARNLLGNLNVNVVSVDMPVATDEIRRRRAADDAISQAFGQAGCGTHSPNANRPGQVGAALSQAFSESGYALATMATQAPTCLRLVEVYPHTALLALTNSTYRLPYKVSKSGRYWPNTPIQTRIANLLAVFQGILTSLNQCITRIPLVLPQTAQVRHLSQLKRYEDAIDALICCWVGVKYLSAQIIPRGDNSAAIWNPV